MDTSNYLQENRKTIISTLERKITTAEILFDKAATNLKGAMIIYKEVLEATENTREAMDAAKKAIEGSLKVSKYIFLSPGSINQLPSSMR